MFLVLETCGKLGNIVFATKIVLNLFGNIFASKTKQYFVSATMFAEVGKLGNIIENLIFPQQCFLDCPKLYPAIFITQVFLITLIQ